MSYYENRIKALEARIEEMAQRERLKAIPVEAKLFDRWAELVKENKRLKEAGDWILLHWSSGDGSDPARWAQSAAKWKEAKQGKDQ